MNKKAQIAPFVVIMTVVLLLAIVATAIIGESAFTRVRLASIVDGALLSGASQFCQGLNQLRILNKQLFMSWITLQVQLLYKSPWNIAAAYATILAQNLINMDTFKRGVEPIIDDMPKNLRARFYDFSLGGGLVDEAEPMLQSDLILDSSGAVKGLNYTSYMARLATEGSRFTRAMRDFKLNNGGWYKSDILSYSFNKTLTQDDWVWDNATQEYQISNPGVVSLSPPDTQAFESYVTVQLSGVPNNYDIKVKPKRQFLFFLWSCGPYVCPGFGTLEYGGIKSIDFGSKTFSLTVKKRVPFLNFPFFPRSVEISNTGRVKITGTVGSGYEPKLAK